MSLEKSQSAEAKSTRVSSASGVRFSNKVSSEYADEVEEYVYETDDEYEYIEIDESDPDYEYYEDGDEIEEEEPPFFNGNFPPPPPPMPFYVPPPVEVVANRNFPHGMPMRPMFDPALREEMEYAEVEEDDDFENTSEADAEPLSKLDDYFGESEETFDEETEEIDVITAAPISSMKTAEAEKMLELGQQQEIYIQSGKYWLLLKTIFKWLISIFIVAAFSVGCAYLAISLFDTKSSSSEGVVVREARVGNFEWRLKDGQARTCLESFYKSIGISKDYITAPDILMKGTIVFGKNSDSVYIVKKLVENKSFIKIGNGNMAKAYFMDGVHKNVNAMLDGGMSGRRRELSKVDSLILRAFVLFDDSIFLRAFSQDFLRRELDDISYEGETDANGKSSQVISVKERDDINVKFFFENKTSNLIKVEYTQNETKVEVLLSDYKLINNEQKRPFKRSILVNSKPYAEMSFDFIVCRDGLLFPN